MRRALSGTLIDGNRLHIEWAHASKRGLMINAVTITTKTYPGLTFYQHPKYDMFRVTQTHKGMSSLGMLGQ